MMDLFISFVVGVLTNWFAEDLKPWLFKLKRLLVRVAVFLAPKSERNACLEAWTAEAEDIEGNIKQISWALFLAFASLRMHYDIWREKHYLADEEYADEYVVVDGVPFADVQAIANRNGGHGYITLDELSDLSPGDIIKVSTALKQDDLEVRLAKWNDPDFDLTFINESFWMIVKETRGQIILANVDNDLLFSDCHGMFYGDLVRVHIKCVRDVIKVNSSSCHSSRDT